MPTIAAEVPTTVLATVSTTLIAAVLLSVSRCDKRPEHEKGGDCEPCHKLRRQVTFRSSVYDAGHGELLR
jgi:hypothetical protein